MLRRYHKLMCLVLVPMLLSLCLVPVNAQDITGSISGIVKDSNGGLIAGATVIVRDSDKNIVVRTVTTDSDGTYSAPLLPIGHYAVSVEASGFKKHTSKDIELNVNDQ